ncbi:hypothetical protein MYO4S_00233 [Serratia phage 4S]|nr:hypothetical protein MYO4S_00233 [Serratia phage 4S]
MNFKDFLSEGAYEIRQAALKSGLGYTNDIEGRRKFEQDWKHLGNANNILNVWKSLSITGEIFDPKLPKSKGTGQGPAAAPAAKAPAAKAAPKATKAEKPEKFPVATAEFKKLWDANKKVMEAYEAAGKLAQELVNKMQPFYNGKSLDFRTQYSYFAVAGIKDIVDGEAFRDALQKRLHIAEEAYIHSKKL